MTTSMTRDDIQAFAQRFLTTWERADPQALAACYAADATVDSPMFQKAVGREQIEETYFETFRIFAGFKFTLDDIIIDAESMRAVAIVTTQATQIGEAFGYPGSGRHFTLKVAFVLRFSGDSIISETRVYDFTGLLVQLGVLRAKKA
jgi:steroid delta-isomerase-like uncharacterized protein